MTGQISINGKVNLYGTNNTKIDQESIVTVTSNDSRGSIDDRITIQMLLGEIMRMWAQTRTDITKIENNISQNNGIVMNMVATHLSDQALSVRENGLNKANVMAINGIVAASMGSLSLIANSAMVSLSKKDLEQTKRSTDLKHNFLEPSNPNLNLNNISDISTSNKLTKLLPTERDFNASMQHKLGIKSAEPIELELVAPTKPGEDRYKVKHQELAQNDREVFVSFENKQFNLSETPKLTDVGVEEFNFTVEFKLETFNKDNLSNPDLNTHIRQKLGLDPKSGSINLEKLPEVDNLNGNKYRVTHSELSFEVDLTIDTATKKANLSEPNKFPHGTSFVTENLHLKDFANSELDTALKNHLNIGASESIAISFEEMAPVANSETQNYKLTHPNLSGETILTVQGNKIGVFQKNGEELKLIGGKNGISEYMLDDSSFRIEAGYNKKLDKMQIEHGKKEDEIILTAKREILHDKGTVGDFSLERDAILDDKSLTNEQKAEKVATLGQEPRARQQELVSKTVKMEQEGKKRYHVFAKTISEEGKVLLPRDYKIIPDTKETGKYSLIGADGNPITTHDGKAIYIEQTDKKLDLKIGEKVIDLKNVLKCAGLSAYDLASERGIILSAKEQHAYHETVLQLKEYHNEFKDFYVQKDREGRLSDPKLQELVDKVDGVRLEIQHFKQIAEMFERGCGQVNELSKAIERSLEEKMEADLSYDRTLLNASNEWASNFRNALSEMMQKGQDALRDMLQQFLRATEIYMELQKSGFIL